jgi:hypothetical protein
MKKTDSGTRGKKKTDVHARVLLLYGGGAGPPRLQRHGCVMLVCTAARRRGRRDLKEAPLRHTTRASVMAGGVLHPQQAAAYTRGRSTTTAPDLGLMDLDLGSLIFLILKINL